MAVLTLTYMTKETVKERLLATLKADPHLGDIRWVALFGSYINGMATEDSDVDVLIDFESGAVIGFFALSDIKHSLERSLGKTVDILTPQALNKYIRDDILAQAEYIYEK